MLIYRISHIMHPTDGAFGICGAAYDAEFVGQSTGQRSVMDRPTPQQDFKRYPKIDEFCAFPSLEAYREWFPTPEMRQALYASGKACLFVFTVTRVTAKSESQCLFRFEDTISQRKALPHEFA